MKKSEHTEVPREEFQFENCLIRWDTRELLRDGVVQKIERRSFDLIVYLLRAEGRVVSKDELLDHVWGNRFVSDSVIAQSIMKARKALGITSRDPGPIKTIHRVGYRFTGEVRRTTRHTAPSTREQPAIQIMWLPTDCDADAKGLSWVRLGLIPVAAHVLSAKGYQTASAPEAMEYQAILKNQDQNLHRLLDRVLAQGLARAVVATRLTNCNDKFRLEWEVLLDGFSHANTIVGDSPAELTLKAADEVALLMRLHSIDTLRCEDGRQRYKELLQFVVCDDYLHLQAKTHPLLAPAVAQDDCPLVVMAHYLLAIARAGDARCKELAQRLQERSTHQGQAGMAGWANMCLGLYHLYRLELDNARHHLALATPKVHEPGLDDLHPRALLHLAHARACLGDLNDAHALWREAAQAAGLRQNQGLSCWVLAQRAELLYLQRDHQSASATYTEALDAALAHGQQELSAFCGVYVALDHASRGQLDACRRHLEQAWLAADQSGSIQARQFVLLHLGSCYARQGDANGLDQCLIRLGAPALALCPLGQAVSQWLQGRRYLLEDQPGLALPLILQAQRTLNGLGTWCPEESWILLAHVAMQARERRLLVDTLEEIERSDQVGNVAWRRVCTIVLRAMLNYFDADAQAALHDIELAIPLARHTSMAPMLQFAHVWLSLLCERPQALDALASTGDWVIHTREGRYLQAALQDHHRWTWRPRQLPLMLTSGSGTGVYSHLIADLGEDEPTRYVDHLPLPI